ncbi:hypothetical protein B0H19DRAFT_1272805 [Mycena capillaripes]|nr:hypothetical protein B0H19DRAFT_1272762 [Mycena capillaripes]KAJ6532544.1 hypothetical protein B0H19DRAFT_1272805 [Mycena capillaripes]
MAAMRLYSSVTPSPTPYDASTTCVSTLDVTRSTTAVHSARGTHFSSPTLPSSPSHAQRVTAFERIPTTTRSAAGRGTSILSPIPPRKHDMHQQRLARRPRRRYPIAHAAFITSTRTTILSVRTPRRPTSLLPVCASQ